MNVHHDLSQLHRLCTFVIPRLDESPDTDPNEFALMNFNNFYRLLEDAKLSGLPCEAAASFGQDRLGAILKIQHVLVKFAGLTPKEPVSDHDISTVATQFKSLRLGLAEAMSLQSASNYAI